MDVATIPLTHEPMREPMHEPVRGEDHNLLQPTLNGESAATLVVNGNSSEHRMEVEERAMDRVEMEPAKMDIVAEVAITESVSVAVHAPEASSLESKTEMLTVAAGLEPASDPGHDQAPEHGAGPDTAMAMASSSTPEEPEPEAEPKLEREPEPEPEPMDTREAPVKNAREREEDDEEDGPVTKRPRTAEPEDRGVAEFKVPDRPESSRSAPAREDLVIVTSEMPPPAAPITKVQHKFLLSGLRNLKRTKDAVPFNAPVDPVRLNIPTYPDIIKHPMDLSTMEEKLKSETYATVDAYVADFALIVNNTLTFNGPDHVVTRQAMNLQSSFDRQISNLPKPDVAEPAPASKKKAKKAAAAAAVAAAPKATPARRPSRSSAGAAKSPTNNASSPTFALGPSGTPLIRRDSTVGDGRPKREIHPPPPRDLPYLAAKPKKKKFQLELKFCQEALNELNKGKYYQFANPFYHPVDPVALNIPHYHKIVKKPMDMETIGAKLKSGQYENAKEFEADVRLMFNNCYRFNPPTDPIHHMGKQLEGIFNDKWEQKKRWVEDHTPASGPQTPSSSPEPEAEEEEEEEEEDGDGEDPMSEIRALQKQIAAMSKKVEQKVELIQKTKMSPPAASKKKTKGAKVEKKKPKKKSSASTTAAAPAATKPEKKTTKTKKNTIRPARTPYVTYEQKQEISNRINTLPPSKMTVALRIIRDNMPNLKVRRDPRFPSDRLLMTRSGYPRRRARARHRRVVRRGVAQTVRLCAKVRSGPSGRRGTGEAVPFPEHVRVSLERGETEEE